MTLEESGYLAELRASHDPQDETRVENLAELVAVAQEYDDRRATELEESGGELAPGVEPEDVGPRARSRSSSSRSRSSPTPTRSPTSRRPRRRASSR